MNYPHLMAQIINRPLYAHPASALTLFNAIAGRMGVPSAEIPVDDGLAHVRRNIESMQTREIVGGMRTQFRGEISQSRFVGDRVQAEDGSWRNEEPFLRTRTGTAIISITGSMVNRGGYVGAQSGVTSYEGISHQLDRVAADPKSANLVLDIASPGGEAMGNSELAAKVAAVAKIKPVYAVANAIAASAGYAIGSAATEFYGVSSALLGSIGCMMIHLDMTEAAAQQGIKPTVITAGDFKAAGHPLVSLNADALAELKAGIQAYYDLFLNTVAKGRGSKLNKKAARDTQARTYIGKDAVTAGLIDGIATFEEVLQAAEKEAAKSLSTRAKLKGPTQMSLLTAQQQAEQGHETTQQTPAPTPPAPAPQPQAQGMDQRTQAIIAHADVKANAHLLAPALNLAMQAPTMSADQIVAFVKSTVPAPTAAAPAPAPAPTPAPAPQQNLPQAIQERVEATGANNLAGGGHNQGPGPTGNPGGEAGITSATHPWSTHVERTNKRTQTFQRPHVAAR